MTGRRTYNFSHRPRPRQRPQASQSQALPQGGLLTTLTVIAILPEDYIEQIVKAYVASGAGFENLIGLAPSLLVDAKPMLAFAIDWLEAHSDPAEQNPET